MKNEKRLLKWALKIKVLTYYGNGKLACVRCGFNDVRALSLDHINGDGKAHRASVKMPMYAWVERNNYPSMFQTLCYNCQHIKYIEEDVLKAKTPVISLSSRVYTWIDAHDNSKFKLSELTASLGLVGKEYNNARGIVWRLAQAHELRALTNGYYVKIPEQVSVFKHRTKV